MIQFFLSIVRYFRRLILWLGVDYNQFESLLHAKLIMDYRPQDPSKEAAKTKTSNYLGQLIFYALLGLGSGLILLSIPDIFLCLIVFFTMLMVMIGSLLVSEFSTILFDPRDNQILLPRPVNGRTLLFVRLIYLKIHLGSIAFALSAVFMVLLAIKTNVWSVIALLIGVELCVWLTLFITTFVYLALSKMTNAQQFKDWITYMQIIMAILVFASLEFIPKMVDFSAIQSGSIVVHPWMCFLPPVWLAEWVRVFLFSGLSSLDYVLAVIGLIIPLVGSGIVIWLLSYGFTHLLSTGAENDTNIEKKHQRQRRPRLVIDRLLCISEIERAGWKLALVTTSRDRSFKQRIYPGFGVFFVFMIIILKPDFAHLSQYFATLVHTNKYVIIIAFSIALTNVIYQLPFSETPDAAWIYHALPAKNKRHLITGAAKALLFKFFTMPYLVLTLLVCLIWGLAVFPKLLFGYLLSMLLALVVLLIQRTSLPFSQSLNMIGKNSNFLRSMLTGFLMVVVMCLLFASQKLPDWATYLICAVVAGGILLTLSSIRNAKYSLA